MRILRSTVLWDLEKTIRSCSPSERISGIMAVPPIERFSERIWRTWSGWKATPEWMRSNVVEVDLSSMLVAKKTGAGYSKEYKFRLELALSTN